MYCSKGDLLNNRNYLMNDITNVLLLLFFRSGFLNEVTFISFRQQMNCCRHCNFSWQNLLNFGILTHTNHEGEAVTVMQILWVIEGPGQVALHGIIWYTLELYVAITDKIPVIVDRPSMMILPSWIPATHDAFVHCLHTNIIASYEYSLGQNCTATRPGHSIWHVVYGVHACQQKKPNMWDFVFCG